MALLTRGVDPFVGNVTGNVTGNVDGILGGTTPAAATVTTLTSNGIDDNATTEVLELADSIMQLGDGTNDYAISQTLATKMLAIAGGTTGSTGSNIELYGNNHSTNHHGMTFSAGSEIWMTWQEVTGALTIYTGGTKTKALTINSSQKATFEGDISFGGALNVAGSGLGDELTIASGVVTVTNMWHILDTQSNDSADDLDTINGGSWGDLLLVQSANSGRDVTLKDGTGNLSLAGDCVLGTSNDMCMMLNYNSTWREICRSING